MILITKGTKPRPARSPLHEGHEAARPPASGFRVKMGAGLSTAYHIMQQHGGEIQIESKEGEGTEVTLVLSSGRE